MKKKFIVGAVAANFREGSRSEILAVAEIDRMNLEVREYLSLHPSELKEQVA